MHRDLKPENILITSDHKVKVCDFGWSCKYEESEVRVSLCGTPEYNAPEILQSVAQTKAVDIWALGILLYELYAHKLPYKDPEMYLDHPVPYDLNF